MRFRWHSSHLAAAHSGGTSLPGLFDMSKSKAAGLLAWGIGVVIAAVLWWLYAASSTNSQRGAVAGLAGSLAMAAPQLRQLIKNSKFWAADAGGPSGNLPAELTTAFRALQGRTFVEFSWVDAWLSFGGAALVAFGFWMQY